MAFVRKCPKCGLDLTDTSATKCPVCGASLFVVPRRGIWFAGLCQIVLVTTFMLLFGFPKFMILIFSAVIVIATIFSAWIKPRQQAPRTAPQRPISSPILLKVIGFFIALSSLVCVALVLFGFVIFMNAWTRWHQYEGQTYHRADFQVKRVYYQKRAKGGADMSASGMVEGRIEYMSLLPYLRTVPRSAEDLDARVPVGTVIPIYLFPNLTGRARVQLYDPVPPAEASHRMAVSTVKNFLLALALMAGVLFVLSRLRELCFAEKDAAFYQVGNP
ncbi:MAG TPA: zinc ribbon domain-containing protein [Terriglobia bacterium]|nr:zinc ribbon domain-containing protein [Terriglobia bacterium]